jgi:Protein of unknown function (DUF993)
MSGQIKLPTTGGKIERYKMIGSQPFSLPLAPLQSRTCFSAAHVVCDPLKPGNPMSDAVLDWDATLAYRHHLWKYGLGVAEAMDTAQRGMGLTWKTARILIRRSIADAKTVDGLIACGAGTDQLDLSAELTLEDVVQAYEEQVSFVEECGGRVILMASRGLAKVAKSKDDYVNVYSKILNQLSQPVILHWLGEMFDPQLSNYWGANTLDDAMQICLSIICENQSKIDGVKISLLSADREIDMRRQLPEDVKMYTGDDYNYDRLILGDDKGFSHALLGIFDAIAPVASAAIQALDAGDIENYHKLFSPTIPLSRYIFQTPTQFYKTGIVFIAYLNGHQRHFKMVGGQESARSVLHFTELFRLADIAGLFTDAEATVIRMKNFLRLAGIEQ